MSSIPTKQAAMSVTGVVSLVLSQKGLADGAMEYGPGGTSPQITTCSSIDTHNGNVSSNETSKRPTNLDVNSAKSLATKNRPKETNESSLPCTPELESDELQDDTRQLIRRFLRDYTGLSKPAWKESKALSTLKRVVEGLLEKHRYAYNGMVNRLSLDNRGGDVSFVSEVAQNLFADNTANWGRIASLVAFGAVVSQSMNEKGQDNCVELVAEEISTYLLSDQREWLVKNNSWDGFVEFFQVADPESTVRTTLMAFAGFAGIGATLALLIR